MLQLIEYMHTDGLTQVSKEYVQKFWTLSLGIFLSSFVLYKFHLLPRVGLHMDPELFQ